MRKIVTFNGVDMSKYFRVTDIVRPIGNDRSITTNDALNLGVTVQQVKRGAKEHTIKFDMKTDNDPMVMETLKHELAGVLNVTEPVKITYSDESDKYYLGLVTGDVTPDNITRWFQRSEIKFIIPDGVAHSTTYRKIDSNSNATVSSGKMTFNVTNNGTEYAYPIITVKHNYDNGYLGLVNNNAALEIGNREEVDTEDVKRSELLFDYRDDKILTGFSSATKNAAITNDKPLTLNSTLNTVSVWGRYHVQLATRGNGTGNNLNCGSLTWEIPADSSGAKGSLNDYIWWRQIFWLGDANQYGFLKVSVSDADGNFLYGTETFKRSNGLTCEYNFLTTDGKGGYKVQQRWTFTGTHLDTQNPFNSTRGFSDLKRNDDIVQVYWWGSYPKFRVPEIKGKKSAKIHVTFGAIGQKTLVTHMYLDGIAYRKDYVPATLDIPNRFSKGTNVIINSEDDTLYIDGIPKTNDVVNGSDWLSIPPGNSQLELYTSSWVKNMPTVTVEFEERYL